jgi:hypothetical protein
MPKRKRFVAVLLSTGITCILVISLISLHNCTSYKKPSYCARAQSDARIIAPAIADYFAIPEHTDIKPSDLKDLELKNPWTFTKCGDEIIIIVYDREMKCPLQGQYYDFEWKSHLCILKF